MLEGFKRIYPSRGIASLAIVKNALVFNKNVAKYFGERSCVVFLVNKEQKRIAIQKVDGRDKHSITFYRRMNGGRLTYRNLMREVLALGNFDLEHHYYKVKGVVDEDEKAIIFDLNEVVEKDRIFRNRDNGYEDDE